MKTNTLFIGLLLATRVLLAFEGDDFVSANHDPKHPEEPAIVLRVPKAEQRASLWNPQKEQLPLSPEAAIKLVLASELVHEQPKVWIVRSVQFFARHPMLYSDLETATSRPFDDPTLIVGYYIDVQRLTDGKSFPFMVLMNGKVYSPKFEKQPSTTQ